MLEDFGMHYRNISMADTVEHMLDEMSKGLAGEKSSLAMIPTYIQADAVIPANRKTVVIDAGGTNLRAAVVSFTPEGKPCIEDFTKTGMPGTGGSTVGKDEFFSVLAGLVKPLLDKLAGDNSCEVSDSMGFCFSYPTEIYPDKDGRLLYWSKEIQAPEVEGCLIGANLRDALIKAGLPAPPKVVILNDTVATLLAGKAAGMGRQWGGYGGYILGTGINSCYVESESAIGKLQMDTPPQSQVVNCESGSYACRNRGRADERLNSTTNNPKIYWLEKMAAGGYFGLLAFHTMQLAAQEGLFSASFASVVNQLKTVTTKDADNYLHNPSDKENTLAVLMARSGSGADACRLWFLGDFLLERAARLTAAHLAALVLKSGEGKGPLAPVCLTIDGTAYYRYYRFQSRVEGLLRPLLAERNWYYETLQVDDAPLLGAAAAALTN